MMKQHTILMSMMALFVVLSMVGLATATESGGVQLKKAMDAGIVEISQDGTWWDLASAYALELGCEPDEFFYFIETFYPDSQYYPYPEVPIGMLARILAEKRIYVNQINPGVPVRVLGPNDIGTAKDAILQAILARIAAHYGVEGGITIEWHARMPPSNDWNLFHTSNEAGADQEDLTDCIISIGGIYVHPITGEEGPRPDYFLHTVPILSNAFQTYVPKRSMWSDAAQMKQIIHSGRNVTICMNRNNGNVARSTFQGDGVTFHKVTGDVEAQCMELLLNGEVDIFFSEYIVHEPSWRARSRIIRFNKAAPTAYWMSDR